MAAPVAVSVVGDAIHTAARLEEAATTGSGLTVTINDCAGPKQVPVSGVTEITAVTGTVPVLMAVNAAIVPEPDAPSPIDVLVLVQV